MSTDRNVDRIVGSWLKEDRHEDASRVLGAVLNQVDTTSQRRAWWPARRFLLMNDKPVRIGLVAVVVATLAIVGMNLLFRQDVGHPVPTPSLTSYAVGPDQVASLDTHQLTFMVPEGWTDLGGRGVRKNDVSLTVWVSPRGIWVNPCYWSVGDDLGRFADPPFYRGMGMLEAFWDWWGAPEPIGFGNWAGTAQATLPHGSAPIDATVDQFAARYVEFRVPDDLDLESCDEGEYRIWVGNDERIKTSAPGERDQIWLLKVGLPDLRAGGMVMIVASSLPGSSAQDVAELEAMVASIRFETSTSVPTAKPDASATEAPSTFVVQTQGGGIGAPAYRATVALPPFYGWVTDGPIASVPGVGGFSAWNINGIYPDPCHWNGAQVLPLPGHGASHYDHTDQIASLLANQPGRNPSELRHVEAGGWLATLVELSLPDTTACDAGQYRSWRDLTDRGGPGYHPCLCEPVVGQRESVYILDIDRGVVVIDMWEYPGMTSEGGQSALDSVLASLVVDFGD